MHFPGALLSMFRRRSWVKATPYACRACKPAVWAGSGEISRRGLLTKAYGIGPTEPPLLEQTILESFDETVSKHGDRPAVISHHQNEVITWRELQERSNAIAHGLKSIGVTKGDRIGVSMGNCSEFAILTYSIFRLGAILVPLNPSFTPNQVISALNHLQATHLLTGIETNLPFKAPLPNQPLFEKLIDDHAASTITSTAVPSLKHVVVADNTTPTSTTANPHELIKPLIPLTDLISRNTTSPVTPAQNIHDTINIQFTSGTTGRPKAAQLSHSNILNNGHSIGRLLGLTPSDVVCCAPPLFHCFGSVIGYLACATHGSALLFSSAAYDPRAVLEAIVRYRATALYGVPTMFNSQLALLDGGQFVAPPAADDTEGGGGFGSLRTGVAAGSSVPAELMRKLHKKLNMRDLAICYGMTETSPVSCMTTAQDPLQKRTDTVGRAMPHVRVKVVDPVTRELLGVGQRGELMTSGYLVMSGYYADEKKTAEAFEEEVDAETGEKRTFMSTGDEAVMDEEGYVRITGRIKDLIIRGGENIHPLEIEDCLLGMDGVVDVSVVGVKDEKYGEVVAAFVIRSDKADGVEPEPIRSWVRERLSRHLVPKFVFFTDQFPKTGSGKVQKFALREEAEKLLKEGKGL